MSLATRCPSCHTVFRVVQDQLRVSEGWVRCGQCQEVFNALETLFDLGPLGVAEPPAGEPTPPAQPPAPQPESRPEQAPTTAAPEPEPADEPVHEPEPAHEPEATMSLDELAAAPVAEPAQRPRSADAESPPPAAAPPAAPPAAEDQAADAKTVGAAAPEIDDDDPFRDIVVVPTAEEGELEDTEEPTPSRFVGPTPDWAKQPARERRSKKSKPKAALAAGDAHAQTHESKGAHRRRRKPEFVRQAERAAMWRRPMMRALLGGAALLLGAILLLQFAYQYREPLTAQVPSLAPSLRMVCAWAGCRIGPPRAIERVRLDASDLTRTDEEQVLRLTAEIHNTADFAVRTPALDVSFTDALGRTVARKVLLPTELGARGEAIDADAHWRVDARLAVGELRIAGYTVEVFYP